MKITYYMFILVAMVSVTSCIPLKKLTYLQENETVQDSLVSILKMPEPYRLQVNDLLSVRIKALDQETIGIFNPVGETNPNATGEQRLYYDGFVVDVHGNIRMPVLGNVPVLGFTVEEIQNDIEKRLNTEYFKEGANVFVTVKLSGIRYVINGEIGRPGSNIIYRDQVSIMEAIASNGDITVTGDRTNVIIIRQYPLGQRVHHIDLTNINAMNSPYYYVKPNDLILINPLPQKATGLGTTGLQTFTTVLAVFTALMTTILLIVRL